MKAQNQITSSRYGSRSSYNTKSGGEPQNSSSFLLGEPKRWTMALFTTLLVISMKIGPSVSSCTQPPRVKNGEVTVQDEAKYGAYSNGSRAVISCNYRYRVSSTDTMFCINGQWITADRSTPRCGKYERTNPELDRDMWYDLIFHFSPQSHYYYTDPLLYVIKFDQTIYSFVHQSFVGGSHYIYSVKISITSGNKRMESMRCSHEKLIFLSEK
jgi:hypothetical protein